MSNILKRLDRFWFTEAHSASLALLRILIGGYALFYLWTRYSMLIRIADSQASLFAPVGAASFLETPIPTPVFELVLLVTLAMNVAYVLGCAFRWSGPLFGVLLLFVLCYRNSWSMVYHSDNLLVLHALIIGCSRASDSLSLDGLARRLARGPSDNSTADLRPAKSPIHWKYGWPIRLICLVTLLTYFLAGVAKVAGPLGWTWATGDALRSQVAVDALRKELLGGGASRLVFLLYDHVWVFTVMAVSALVLELGAPVAFCFSRISRFWAVTAFLFHWGVLFVMGIKFRYQLAGVAFAAFFLWTRPVSPQAKCRETSQTIAGALPNTSPS